MKDDDLGSAFAPPSTADRAAGLRGLAGGRRPGTVQELRPVVVAPPAPVVAPQELHRAVVLPAGHQVELTREGADDYAVVYLGQRVHRRLGAFCQRRARKRRAPSFTSVVLDAVEALHDRLPDLFAVPADPEGGSLFARRRPLRRVLVEPQVQVTLKPGRDNVAVLDRLARECGQSRSALVDRVLDEFLPGRS